VVLQHGFCRNHRFWTGWVPYLARRHRVLRPDLPGCGDSGHLSAVGLDLTTLADLLGDTLAATTDRPVHYVGESLGGILGVVLAATRPELVASLSLVSTPLWVDPMVGTTQALGEASWSDAIRRYGMHDWWLASRTRMRHTSGTERPSDAWMAEQVRDVAVDTAVALVAIIESADVRALAAEVRVPVTVLVPEGSKYANRASQRGYYDAFPTHTVRTVAGANHEMYLENVDVVAPMVAGFMDEVDGRC
ncbi:MAG TPA: alpha/beta fold hydrolase, partial [Pseudonocardiaceae bacterium]|nr:alpha/beta fold hydrolase [Pseudonocardiaceae bacterium]